MLVSVDTNVLAYANGSDDAHRQSIALDILESLPVARTVVAAQALGELFNVLTRKKAMQRPQARGRVLALKEIYTVLDTSADSLDSATLLAADHAFSIWDAIILSVSASAGCRILLSEDMQHGFEWRGVTVINPFLADPHPLLRRAFSG